MVLIQISGHLGADPETRFTPSGQKVTTFRVAVNSKKGNKERTMWWRVTVWGEHLERRMKFLKKGSAVTVRGELTPPDIYQDREGNPQVSLEITAEAIEFSPFGGKKTEDGTAQPASSEEASSPYQGQGSGASAPAHAGASAQNFDDDLPF